MAVEPHRAIIRVAEPKRDNAALCELSRACPQGDGLRFFYQRKDFWERCRLFAGTTVLAAERNNHLVGVATVARKHVWIRGTLQPVAYLCDRMVHPDHRRQGIGRALLQAQQVHSSDALLRYCLVLEDNQPNRRLLEAGGFVCHPKRLLYFTILPRLAASRRRRPWTAQHALLLRNATSSAAHAQQAVRLGAQYDFVDPIHESGEFLWGDDVAGAAAVVHRATNKVFVDAPWYHRLLSRLLPFVPGLNRPIASSLLTHLGGPPQAVAQLIPDVARAALDAGVELLLLPLYENDPRNNWVLPFTIHRFGVTTPTRVCLYLHGPRAPALLHCERPLLASARDG